jgi:hypothetical protein
MRRRLLAAALLLPAVPAAAGTLPPPDAEYEADQTQLLNGVALDAHIRHARGAERREATADGIREVLIVRRGRPGAVVWAPALNLASEVGLDEAGPTAGELAGLEAAPEGHEVVGGLDTVRYRVSGRGAGGFGFDGHVWSTGDGVYARIEGTATEAEGGEPVKVAQRLRNVTPGPQDPALFALPAGVQSMTLDVLPGRTPPLLKEK